MELNCERQTVTINEIVLDTSVEQSLQSDILLADYCPDIVKILRSFVTPTICCAKVIGERLTLEGTAAVKVCFLTEEKTIHCHSFSIPFSKSCDLKGEAALGQDLVVQAQPRLDYMNCRAVSSRRIDARGALTIRLTVSASREIQVVSSASEEGVQLRQEPVSGKVLWRETRTLLPIREELGLPQGKESVLRVKETRARASVTDCKALANKAIVKGELYVTAFAVASQGENAQRMDYSVPFSQVIDFEGLEEENSCSALVQVESCTLRPRGDLDGENRSLDLDAQLCFVLRAHRRQDALWATDCFGTRRTCQGECRQITLIRELYQAAEAIRFSQTFQLPDGVRELKDLWADVSDIAVTQGDDGGLRCVAKLNFYMEAVDDSGCADIFDRSEEVSCRIPVEIPQGQRILFYPVLTIEDLSYSFTEGGRLQVSCPVLAEGTVYALEEHRVLQSLQVNPDEEEFPPRDCALILYFAREAESVWDIAKRYQVSPRGIMEENGLADDRLSSGRMLLIPAL